MGKITDITVSLVILILFLYVAARMGLTFSDIYAMFHHFFFSGS